MGIISLVRMKKVKLHALLQKVLFLVSVIVLTYFETGVRMVGGFETFMKESGVEHDYAFLVLIIHITISVMTLILWLTTIFMAKKQLQLGKHKQAGKLTFIGVTLTSLTGIWVYLLMFVY